MANIWRNCPSNRLRQNTSTFYQQIPDGNSAQIQDDFFEPASASSILNYTGSGTLSFSGSATENIIESFIGSGTLSFSGTADLGESTKWTKVTALTYINAPGAAYVDLPAINIQAGDFLGVAVSVWTDGVSVTSIRDAADSSNQCTLITDEAVDPSNVFGYVLKTTSKSSSVIRISFSTTLSQGATICLYQYRPSTGYTGQLDQNPSVATGTGTTAATNSITTTNNDSIVFTVVSNRDGTTSYASELIGGKSCTEYNRLMYGGPYYSDIFLQTFAAIKSSIFGQVTLGSSDIWNARIVSFLAVLDSVTLSYSGSGTLSLSGNASQSIIQSFTSSGNLILSGAASTSIIESFTGSGNLILSGSATTSYVSTTILNYTGSGTLSFSGTGTTNEILSDIGSGTLLLSGSASKNIIESYLGTGTLAFSGSASKNVIESFTGSGNLALSGSASKNVIESFTGSGALSFSGTANRSEVISYSGSGTLQLSGSASFNEVCTYQGFGDLLLNGSATVNQVLYYSGSGELLLSGSATTSSSGEGTYIYAITFYNGIKLACEIPPSSSDIRIKKGGSIIGVPVVSATDNHAGSVRIKVNGITKALKIN